MPNFSFWVLGESNISFTGSQSVTLDGITQGDGSHLVGQDLTINATDFSELYVSDRGNDTDFDDNDGRQRLDGDQVVDGVQYSDNTKVEAEYQFVVEDADGNQYTVLAVNINNQSHGEQAYSTNEAIAFVDEIPPVGVPLRVVSAAEGPGGSGQASINESRIVPVCFNRGTLIDTGCGAFPVEKLVEGQKIRRADGTFVVLKKLLSSRFTGAELTASPNLYPVRITACALGNGRPLRDLVVSRQHRVLVNSPVAKRMFGCPMVLIPAIRLTDMPGVYVDTSVTGVEYFHLIFDQHEVIVSEGTPTESLYPGPVALGAISRPPRQELLKIFPKLADPGFQPKPAQVFVSGKRAKNLVARHVRNQMPITADLND